MSNGYFIQVSNNLLDPKHLKAIGSAWGEYLWCLDKMTKIKDHTGYVLGGKPVQLADLVAVLGKSRFTISRNLSRLEQAGYLELTHTPYGIVIKVTKAKKWFAETSKPMSKKRKPLIKNSKPNKTIQLDNTVRQEQPVENEHQTFFKKPSKKSKHIKSQTEQILQLFRTHREGSYSNRLHTDAVGELIAMHGIDRVTEVTEFALTKKQRKFEPEITKPVDLGDHWPTLVALMSKPEDKYEGIF